MTRSIPACPILVAIVVFCAVHGAVQPGVAQTLGQNIRKPPIYFVPLGKSADTATDGDQADRKATSTEPTGIAWASATTMITRVQPFVTSQTRRLASSLVSLQQTIPADELSLAIGYLARLQESNRRTPVSPTGQPGLAESTGEQPISTPETESAKPQVKQQIKLGRVRRKPKPGNFKVHSIRTVKPKADLSKLPAVVLGQPLQIRVPQTSQQLRVTLVIGGVAFPAQIQQHENDIVSVATPSVALAQPQPGTLQIWTDGKITARQPVAVYQAQAPALTKN